MTYNVRGLQNKNKRIKIFNYIKERNASGICLLQETHSDENVYKSWQIDWGQSESFLTMGRLLREAPLYFCHQSACAKC